MLHDRQVFDLGSILEAEALGTEANTRIQVEAVHPAVNVVRISQRTWTRTDDYWGEMGEAGMSRRTANLSFLTMWISQPGMDALHKAAMLESCESMTVPKKRDNSLESERIV